MGYKNNETEINKTVLSGTQTEINFNSINNTTAINPDVATDDGSNLELGTVLCEKYKVICKLEVESGEADLYICEYENNKYIAKVYKREIAIKKEVINALKKIDSPFVSKIYETSIYNGKPFEILPYYKNGNLQGKKFTFEELLCKIIPDINEALNVLHINGIIHKDLKPSNIMLADNGKDVAVIDFGISSVKNDNNTVLLTKTGMTPAYSAPETFHNLYLNESDYYSFGITLFELFCGHTPYGNMELSRDELEKYISVQKFPFPSDMPSDLKDLISALTYSDITNRKNKSNHNRRWTYDEVKQWCDGKKLIIPGESIGNLLKPAMIPYTFLGKQYLDIPSLAKALAENWEAGKKQLFRGLISGYYKNFNPEIASLCLEAELESTRANGKDDIIFWKFIYKICPELKAFYWKSRGFESLPALGRDMLERLWKKDNSEFEYYNSILSEKLLSSYVQMAAPENNNLKKLVESIEAKYKFDKNDNRSKMMTYYLMAYMISGQKILDVDGIKFRTVGELAEHVKGLLEKSYEEFESFCHQMIDYEDNLDVRLESWLISIGKRAELDKWKQMLVE